MKVSVLLSSIAIPAALAASGKYIVQLKPGIAARDVEAHHNAVRSIHRRVAGDLNARDVGEGLKKTYSIGDFNAYSGSFDETTIHEIEALSEVEQVEEDVVMYLWDQRFNARQENRTLVTQSPASWGLGSISHRAPGSEEYVYDESAGKGTFAYVVDTGVRVTHEEFENRATFAYNALEGTKDADDYGHGSHVASTIAGKTYGVAKKAQIMAVKIFEGGSGSAIDALDGYNWAVNHIIDNDRQNISVINLSAGSVSYNAWDNAVTAAFSQGVLTAVAAGNYDSDVMRFSPARAAASLTVGNSDRNNARYVSGNGDGSNYGSAVDIWAPGTDIIGAGYINDTGTQTLTGTSMACPHIAGLVCYIRGLEGSSTATEITERVAELSTKDVVTDVMGSLNRLAYNGNGL